jgi:hypothetical protein
MKTRILFLAVAANFFLAYSSSIEYIRDEYIDDREIRNPYAPGSGQYAGYEWAKEAGGACTGNSESFTEGCEEYYRQVSSR